MRNSTFQETEEESCEHSALCVFSPLLLGITNARHLIMSVGTSTAPPPPQLPPPPPSVWPGSPQQASRRFDANEVTAHAAAAAHARAREAFPAHAHLRALEREHAHRRAQAGERAHAPDTPRAPVNPGAHDNPRAHVYPRANVYPRAHDNPRARDTPRAHDNRLGGRADGACHPLQMPHLGCHLSPSAATSPEVSPRPSAATSP